MVVKTVPVVRRCGLCTACRITIRQEWTLRILLESKSHPQSWFVTLTYDDEHLPSDGSVNKRDPQLFFKRLRERTGRKYRYYLAAEYGDKNLRPHYHAIIFGSIPVSADLQKIWGMGFVHVGFANTNTIQYTTSYVLKKLTKSQDDRLQGRYPEFALMSRGCKADGTKGLGYEQIKSIAAGLKKAGVILQSLYDGSDPDRCYNPQMIEVDGKQYPMDRYLRQKLITESGGSGEMTAITAQFARARKALVTPPAKYIKGEPIKYQTHYDPAIVAADKKARLKAAAKAARLLAARKAKGLL